MPIFIELRKLGYSGSKTAFYDYLRRLKGQVNISKLSLRYETNPGVLSQFDWAEYWITSGLRDYFPNATYLLCRFHLNKHLRESLARRKPEQKLIKDLLLSNQIEKALERINSLLLHPYDRKEKELLSKFYSYLSHNRQGISNQVTLKDKDIAMIGAIESNVNVAIATRFKKQGRSWSKKGALSLLKVKETILNGRWNTWWQKERYHPLQIKPLKPPLPASYFTKEASSSAVIQVRIPALEGPHQGRPWVGVLRKLTELEIG